jgi:hypothetical protein
MDFYNPEEFNYKYGAFGLKISSEIYLPELSSLQRGKADVSINIGKVKLPELSLHEGINFKVTKNEIFRFWDLIGKFKITHNCITIEPDPFVDQTVLRNFILGTIFATLLRLRGNFVLHSSCVNINNTAIAFSGFKGYGKSTTAMAFHQKGYPIVADDYITIEFDKNNNPFIRPGFPSLRLSSASKQILGLSKDDNLEIGHSDKKYVSAKKSFSNRKIPLKNIYILNRGEQVTINKLNFQEAFMELVKNTFGIYMFSKSELNDNFFQCANIVKSVDISKLEILDGIERIPEMVRRVEEDIITN